MSESVDFQSLEQLHRAIENLTGAGLTKLGERGGYKVGLEIENVMKRYPGPPSYPLKWASKKQRAWYFAMRRSKGLPIEYTRTSDPMSQKLGQRWTTQQRRGGAVVGNPSTYAPYVQSSEYQTAMHADTGWVTDKQAVDEVFRSGEVGRIVLAEVHSIVKEAFRGLR